MNDSHALYRTLIQGKLIQHSALSVGGAADIETGTDSCFRDGQGRLTIRGTSLAGALVETAARLFPALVDEQNRLLKEQVTGKRRGLPKSKTRGDDGNFLQSVWRFRNSHPTMAKPPTEWRQGVGIRQATGTTAAEKQALFDFEVVPVGTSWDFFLEIDTFRGTESEALAVLALEEWRAQRGWLGRSAARGTGWIELNIETVLRLPQAAKFLEAWPDNSRPLSEVINELTQKEQTICKWEALVEASRAFAHRVWKGGQWHYLDIPIRLAPGEESFGWNVLQVAGHPALGKTIGELPLSRPLSVPPTGNAWREVDSNTYKHPDSPFIHTTPSGGTAQPFLPGGGLRGPLRHTASRLARDVQMEVTLGDGSTKKTPPFLVRDPNWKDDPLASQLGPSQIRGKSRDEVAALADELTQYFGSEELAGRVLVSDAQLVDGKEFKLAQTEHHAEDEFTAGVYGSSKFDRQVLLSGPMTFRVLLEAPTLTELKKIAGRVLPALELARLGHVPIGGGKWRGAGWTPWQIESMRLTHASQATTTESSADPAPEPLDFRWTQLLTAASSKTTANVDQNHTQPSDSTTEVS